MPDLTVIGVTGSYGKTSVKYYLDTLLKEHFEVLITPESYNTPMGVVKTIRSSLKPSHQIFICEMGARHVGDIKEICDIVHPEHRDHYFRRPPSIWKPSLIWTIS